MLIEFKIEVDGSGGATVVPTSASTISSTSPKTGELGPVTGAGATASPTATKGGAQPQGDPGTGTPPGLGSPGSGTVFVIGPIVIFGSGPGSSAAGGAQPQGDPGTGTPGGGTTSAAK